MTRFLAAARAGDLGALHASIDWTVSGVARFVRSLWQLPASERAEVAAQGLASMRGMAEVDAIESPLATMLPRLMAGPVTAEQVDAARRAAFLEAVTPEDPPPEIGAEVASFVADARARLAEVGAVYRVEFGDEAVWLGVGTGRLVLVRRLAAEDLGTQERGTQPPTA